MASRPARSFTSVLGIALGIATVLAIQVVDHNTILTQERRAVSSFRPDVEIKPVQSGAPQGGATPAALDEEPDLEEYAGLFFNRVRVRVDLEDRRSTSQHQVCGIAPNAAPAFDAYRVEQGRDLSGVAVREVLLTPRMAEKLEVGLGDHLALQRLTPVRQGCLDGKVIELESSAPEGALLDFEVVGILAPWNLGQRVLLVLPFESGLELFQGAHVQPVYWGKLREGAVYQDIRERLKSAWVVEKPRLALIGERIDQRAFRKSIRVTSMLSLLLGLFVIYNAFSMALVERVREIGLLRALGLRRGEIFRAVLIEGSLLAMAGALLGLVLTAALVALMARFQITTLGQGKPLTILEVPWDITVGVVSLGGLFAIFGMAAPLLRARHLSVIEALRVGRLALRTDAGFGLRVAVLVGVPLLLPLLYMMATPPLGERQHAVLLVVLQIAGIVGLFFLTVLLCPGLLHRLVEWFLWPVRWLLPIEVSLAQAAIRGSRLRVLGTLTGVSVVVASIFCVREVNGGFLREMATFSEQAMSGRIYLQTRPLALEEFSQVADIEGIERVYSLSAEVLSPFPLRGVHLEDARAEVAALRQDPELLEAFARGECLLLSQFLADSFGYRVGETPVRLSTFSGARRFEVGAVVDEFGYFPDDRSFALVEAATLENLFCVNDEDGTRYVVELHENADREAVCAALAERLPQDQVLWIRSDQEMRRLYLADRRRDFWVFDVILWLIGLLATIGLLNSLAIALLERRREIALLRTIGLTPRQVGLLLLLESLAVGALGGLLAAALSIPLSDLALQGVRIISRLQVGYELSAGGLLWPLGTALGISLVGALWPARRSGQLDLAALSRYE